MPADELLAQVSDVVGAWPAFGQLPTTEQTSLLNTASQLILNYCARGFAQAMHTEYISGSNNGRILLKHRPVITVAAISINGDPLDNSDNQAWSFVPGTGELVRGAGYGDVRLGSRFPSGTGNIQVQYWAGYVSVPDPVVRATIWTIRWINDQTKVSGLYASESLGDYSYSLNIQFLFNAALPGHIAALLAPYVQDDGLF